MLFRLYGREYEWVAEESDEEAPVQTASFMKGDFNKGGPSGKLVVAMLYENYLDVVSLID